jgi:hypothetical protein
MKQLIVLLYLKRFPRKQKSLNILYVALNLLRPDGNQEIFYQTLQSVTLGDVIRCRQ